MIMPILPMFIKSLGGTGIIIGLIGGIRDGIASILKVVSGYISDKTGKRKIFVFSGYLISSIFKLFLALSRTWHQFLIFSSLERAGKGLRDAPRDAMISSFTNKKFGKNFGVHRTLDTTGAILGSILVFFLFWVWNLSFKSIILIAAIISFLSLVPFYFIEKEKKIEREEQFKFCFNCLPAKLKWFFVISGTFALANFSYMFFILRTQDFFTGRLTIAAPIFLYILFNFFYAVFAIPLGILSDKIGRSRVIGSGYFLFSLTTLGFVFFKTLPAFIFLFILYGIVKALVEGNQRAYVADLSSQNIRATAIGLFYTTTGLITFFSSLIAGILWQFTPTTTFLFGSVVSIISVILFVIFKCVFRN